MSLQKILRAIFKFIADLFDNTTSQEVVQLSTDIDAGKREFQARELLSAMKDDAQDVIIGESIKFLKDNGKVLLGLTKEQKEYAINLAFLMSIKDLDKLTVDELLQYRQLITKTSMLGPAVAEQLHSFWNEFKNTLDVILNKLTDIGVRAGATALKTVIPVLAIF